MASTRTSSPSAPPTATRPCTATPAGSAVAWRLASAFIRPADARGYGLGEKWRRHKCPPLDVAYDPDRAEVSGIAHSNLRGLFERGDENVVGAMQKYRDLTDRGRTALMAGDWDELHKVANE